MPRHVRIAGEFLHIIVRGIGKQIIFEDDPDREFFLAVLKKYMDETQITALAYCLMENHVHLLVMDTGANAPLLMKKLGVSYAGYYNKKYDRTGHLFQDRYKSEVVGDEKYLLAVYRYILKNPQKAGIADAAGYKWSSYGDYGKTGKLTDTAIISSYFGDRVQFEAFMNEDDDREFMEDTAVKHDDAWALEIIRKTINAPSGTVLQQMPKQQRDEMLVLLKSKGITVRQLERLTGINRGVIQKA